jgi:hypothetical protein
MARTACERPETIGGTTTRKIVAGLSITVGGVVESLEFRG